MSSFPTPDIQALRDFLVQYSLGGDVHIEASYTARNHLTCRFRCTQPPQRLLLVTVAPGARDRLLYASRLVQHLLQQGLPVSPVVTTRQGDMLSGFGDNPALLYQLPEGAPPAHQNVQACRIIGDFLGRMHASSTQFQHEHPNPRSLVWLNFAADELAPELSAGDESLLREQLDRFKRTVDAAPLLPRGPLIGSLFADQLFFQDDQLVAVCGFYFSCSDWLLLDVAQAVNEWCCNPHGELEKSLCHALLDAYAARRPFTTVESQYWQDILCFSATRFWVSRLLSKARPQGSHAPRDPEEYKQKLQRRLMGYCPLPH